MHIYKHVHMQARYIANCIKSQDALSICYVISLFRCKINELISCSHSGKLSMGVPRSLNSDVYNRVVLNNWVPLIAIGVLALPIETPVPCCIHIPGNC